MYKNAFQGYVVLCHSYRRKISNTNNTMRYEIRKQLNRIVYHHIPGKRSLRMPANNGKSCAKNLGTLTSIRALINNASSFSFGEDLLRFPAAVITVLTALIPAL